MQCKYPFGGRGTLGLENSSGLKYQKQPIFSFPHLDWRAKVLMRTTCQAATNKDHIAGDSDIFIRVWMASWAHDEELQGAEGDGY